MSSSRNTIPSEDPNAFCRLCFKACNLVSLFPADAEPQYFLVEQILQCIGIQVEAVGHNPSSICWRCAVALEDFYLFRQRSLENDAIIRERYNENFDAEIYDDDDDDDQDDVKWVSTTPAAPSKSVEETQNKIELDKTPTTQLAYPNQSQSSYDMTESGFDFPDFEMVAQEGFQRAYTCQICRAEFASPSELSDHVQQHHSDETKPNKCPICPATFERKGNLERHLMCHGGQLKYSCRECGSRFLKALTLARHQQECKNGAGTSKSTISGGQFKCRYCPKSFKHRPSLNLHVKSHYDMLPCACEICGARFENDHGRIVHQGMFHSGPNIRKTLVMKRAFRCRHCDRSFKMEKYLNQHIKARHTNFWNGNGTEEGQEQFYITEIGESEHLAKDNVDSNDLSQNAVEF